MSRLAHDPEMLDLLGSGQGEPPVRGDVLPPSTGGDRAMVGGAYDGAARFSREMATWNPPIRSVDLDIGEDKTTVDARARDTLRNDAYVASGANIHKDNIVGAMFLLNAKPEWKILGLDEKWAEEFQEEVESKFTLWAESVNNWPDASRMNTLTGLVRLAVGIHLMSGEVLASAEWMPQHQRRPFRTAIQMIDIDRLSNPYYEVERRQLRGGVRRDTYGAPQGYYIKMAHPSEPMEPDAFDWKYVPARKKWGRVQIIHLLEQFRPDQTRGISEMVAALKELRITKRFRDVTLQKAVLEATYAATIESELPTEAVYQALGSGNADAAAISGAVQSYAGGFMDAVLSYIGSAKNVQLDGVRIPHLFPGTKLSMMSPSKGGPLGSEFEQSLLRYIAANLGLSYEQLSRDYSKTNYSSARAAMAETHKYMQARKKAVADKFASHIYALWLEEAIAAGEITSLPKNAPNFWDGLNREAYSQCDWIGASRGQIDELKETQAAVLRLKYGLSTHEVELARLGQDWRKVFAQLEREKKIAEERGLNFATDDNMMNAASGDPREGEAKGEKDDGSEDNTNA